MTDQPKFEVLTLAEARKRVAAIKGRTSFALMARSFMPTTEDRGFEGSACVSVTKAEFMRALESMLSPAFADRGARLRLQVSPPVFQGSSTRVVCY